MAEDNVEQGPLSPTTGTFESLQSYSSSIRRSRPPNIIIGDENRVPLRPGKLANRGSKIGLRSLFGRQKPTRDGVDLEVPASVREPPRSSGGGIRASLAEISNWHYSRSDLSLASPPPPSSSRSTSSAGLQSRPSNSRLRQHSGEKSKPLPAAPSASPASWVPSPLFQVYPQTVKHANLPACSASVETLLRLSNTRSSLSIRDDLAAAESGERKEEEEEEEEKSKRLHQRNAGSRNILNWTTKTYALVTAGYLLQYAADGSFDRLPEKILRLSKDSAAFASDLIPGRHWVIQVISSLDANGTPNNEPRSFISKLALRGLEKKQVSTFLMVFESAEDMDSWLAVLRHEIEDLGGKKRLTETGEVKESPVGQLRTKPSQRTIVVRDPERFSTMIAQDFSWSNDNALKERDHGLPVIPTSELSPEFSMDEGSMTESHYSSDGQQLDNLRESNNRFSCISSGQRTFVTSANSSPACSPTCASFPSHQVESKENQPEVRLRPNAQAISSRRQSMQTVITGFDVETSSRRQSTISTATDNSDSQYSSCRQSIPNFSKRFSGASLAPVESVSDQVPSSPPKTESEILVKTIRKPPPTALVMSRPLSTVMDMPTPISPSYPYCMRNMSAVPDREAAGAAPDTPSPAGPQAEDKSQLLPKTLPSRPTADPGAAPRRFVSMTSLRKPIGPKVETASEAPSFVLSNSVAARKAQFESASSIKQDSPRSFSSMGIYGPDGKLATAPLTTASSYRSKRSSFVAENASYHQARCLFASANEVSHPNHDKDLLPPQHSASSESYSPSLPPSNRFLNVDMGAKSLTGRRSMSQLAEGPPLAPPPTCALPPIPKKI